MARLQRRGIFFGASVTVTRRNFGLVTSRRFVREIVDRGAKLFFFLDYVPVKARTEHLIPSQTQRDAEPLTMMLLRSEFRAVFVAAGMGFATVSPQGDLEPCPFAPCCDPDPSETRRAA